jgi:hypothetical protein
VTSPGAASTSASSRRSGAAGSRGKGLQPRTLEVFDDLGVIDAIRAAGAPYPPLRSYAGGDGRAGQGEIGVLADAHATDPIGGESGACPAFGGGRATARDDRRATGSPAPTGIFGA